jgi:hypothetical protein
MNETLGERALSGVTRVPVVISCRCCTSSGGNNNVEAFVLRPHEHC